MRIAVESKDGVKLASPYNSQMNFMVFEIDEKSDPVSIKTIESDGRRKNRFKFLRNISNAKNMLSELAGCSTVISHNLNRGLLEKLHKSGVDVYITFQNKIDDAISQYFKDKMIHKYLAGN